MYSIPDLIALKQNAEILDNEQIQFLIQEIVKGNVHDAQIGAFLMAVFLKGMVREETVALTSAMAKSGEVLTWPEKWNHLVVDKHSTGGVGDKISLVLAPAIAACGLKIPMISGRSLGFTGGTLDKLESISGFNIQLDSSEMLKVVDEVGCCIVGQTAKLAPADKILYSLRSITSTVGCAPLIVSSILSKKAAEGLQALVLDVKYGNGCYQKNVREAEILAELMVKTSNGVGIKTSAVISNMDHPIGFMVGNSLEVLESVLCLQGKGPDDLMELVTTQGGEILHLMGKVDNTDEGIAKIQEVIHDGRALLKFKQMLVAQGVKGEDAEKLCQNPYVVLPLSTNKTMLYAKSSGTILDINARSIAEASMAVGAGRKNPGDPIARDTGIVLSKHVGDFIGRDEPIMTVYHQTTVLDEAIKEKLSKAVEIKHGCSYEKSKRVVNTMRYTEKNVILPCQ